MEARKFKTGDRVHRKSGGPTMEVVKYALEHRAFVGDDFSMHDVVCVWYDEEGNRHREVFDQRSLYKLEADHGLFTRKD